MKENVFEKGIATKLIYSLAKILKSRSWREMKIKLYACYYTIYLNIYI